MRCTDRGVVGAGGTLDRGSVEVITANDTATALGDDVVHHAYCASAGDVSFIEVEPGFGSAHEWWHAPCE